MQLKSINDLDPLYKTGSTLMVSLFPRLIISDKKFFEVFLIRPIKGLSQNRDKRSKLY